LQNAAKPVSVPENFTSTVALGFAVLKSAATADVKGYSVLDPSILIGAPATPRWQAAQQTTSGRHIQTRETVRHDVVGMAEIVVPRV
jgi:hypothetical protein